MSGSVSSEVTAKAYLCEQFSVSPGTSSILALPGSLLEMEILRPHSRPTVPELPGSGMA